MAFTPGEETILKALVIKLVQRKQARDNLNTKQEAVRIALANYYAAIDPLKTVSTVNGTREESIDPGALAAAKAIHEPLIAQAKADLAQTIADANADLP